MLLIFVLAGTLVGLALGLIVSVGMDLPEIRALEDFEPGAVTRILSEDGQVLSELYVEKRLPLKLEEIPLTLRQAFISVEDRRFERHPGLDLIRNFGALVADIRQGRFAEGGSTITQQLARNLFLHKQKTIQRKLKEIFLALQIERRYTKDEILRLYLNQIYLGPGVYGVGVAAGYYFDKDLSQLTVQECALLAGLPKSPGLYSPFNHPKRALSRRNIVLQAMAREGYLSQSDAETAMETPLAVTRPEVERAAPFFVRQVKKMLLETFGENAVYKGGLAVQTTLDSRLQAAAEEAVGRGLEKLESRINPVKDSGPAGDHEKLQCALVALEAGTGRILAWVGGMDYHHGSPDRIEETGRRPGSAIIPFIYADAIESGMTQADRIWDAPVTYRLPGQGKTWRPQNTTRRFEGEITLRRALEVAGAIPAIKLLSHVGLDHFADTLSRFGIAAPDPPDLTLALGEFDTTLLDMVSAYNALAGQGLWYQTYGVARVLDRNDRPLYQVSVPQHVAVSPETAYILTDMLKGTVESGTAQRAKLTLNRPLAGMTGTTRDDIDASFIGYSPEIIAGVWVGYDSKKSMGPGWTGARTALPIWIDFMHQALADRPSRDFKRPPGVVFGTMNRVTGQAAVPGTSGAVNAAFKAGSRPQTSALNP